MGQNRRGAIATETDDGPGGDESSKMHVASQPRLTQVPATFGRQDIFMSRPLTKCSTRVLIGMAAALLFATAGEAQRGGPFAHLSGNWSGSGTISTNTGAKERIRCRAQYKVSPAGSDVQLELRCASDSYKFELQGQVSHNDGNVSGTWTEVTRGAVGTISGTSKGSQLNLRASSPVFSAILNVNTHSNSQSISIQSPGSEISAVSITLNRGGR
jgi:hypothetical protein